MTPPTLCLLNSGPCAGLRSHFKRTVCVCSSLALVLVLTFGAAPLVTAQVKPEVRDRVVPAMVLIMVMAEVTERGVARPQPVVSGSGTIVSAGGQILTNWHVVDMAEHRRMLDSWEQESAANGQSISIDLIDDAVLVFTSDGENPPQPQYIATIAATDEALDLAVLQIVADGNGLIDPASLNLPFVSIGDSDAVRLGDPVDIFGYPAITVMTGGGLTYTQGVVSGFVSDQMTGRVWINTDATMAEGSSGGAALDREGQLIGVPTQGSLIDCRPGDMNQDGRVDAQDVGCMVTGGSIGQLRPINLARELLMVIDPTGQGDGGSSLHNFLPDPLPVPHAACFHIENDGTMRFDQLLERFDEVSDAASRLRAWGWQASAYRTFGCDRPPSGEAGWIEINVHLFGDAASAQEAVDYFAAVRAGGARLMSGGPAGMGDYSTTLSGPASNGKEFTIYASQGPMLVRVTGVSRDGIPFGNVVDVARAVLVTQPASIQAATIQSPSELALPASAFLPAVPAVNYAECFSVQTEGSYTYDDVVDAVLPTGLTQAQFNEFGWQDGAYRVFTCANPPVGRATQIDVGIHRFQDGLSAQRALPYYSRMYELGENAARHCDDAGTLVICVSGRSPTGSPLSDVHFVLQDVVAAAGG